MPRGHDLQKYNKKTDLVRSSPLASARGAAVLVCPKFARLWEPLRGFGCVAWFLLGAQLSPNARHSSTSLVKRFFAGSGFGMYVFYRAVTRATVEAARVAPVVSINLELSEVV